MIDRDLAILYGTETKSLNLAVKRNIKRFPSDFMFQVTKEELSQIIALENSRKLDAHLRFQIETSKKRGDSHYLPLGSTDTKEQLKLIKSRIDEHDVQLNHIYEAIENLLDNNVSITKWEERERIGFQPR